MGKEAEIEVRSKLERALRRKLYEAVWQELLNQGLVREYLKGTLEEDPKEAWRVLKEAAENRMRFAEAVRSEDRGEYLGGREAPPDKYEKDDGELEAFLDYFLFIDSKSAAMHSATSAFFGWLADQHPEVVRFRDEVLGGRTLTPDQARNLLGSYAARFFSLEWFSDWSIPVVGHTSEIVGGYDWGSYRDEIDHRVMVLADPPGITRNVRYAHPDTPILDEDQIHTRCVLRSGEVVPPYKAELPSDEDIEVMRSSSPHSNMGPTLLGNYETRSRPSSVWPGSVIDNLYALSEELADTFRWPGKDADAESFRWWRKDAAAEFVLTGVAPLMRPLDVRLYRGGGYLGSRWRIELDVSPWVSAEEVSRAYKRMQDQVIEGRNRLPDRKTFKVARFVWEQERQNGYKRPKWPVLMERWNREHPGEDRFGDYRHFRTYFMRGDRAVKELNFDWPGLDEKELPNE